MNPTTGALSGSFLTTNAYYDHRGNQVAESDPGGLWTKSQYDGAGRDVMDYTTDGGATANVTPTWAAASSVSNDIVLEQQQTIYDNDSNAIETIDSQRFHNDPTTAVGALGNPTSGIGARVYYAAAYYDNADRLTASVDVGTNGGSSWTRPNVPPTPSATALVTTYAYNGMGLVQDVTDPMGIVNRTLYDNLGRTTKTIQDYTGGTPGVENDVATEYGYDGNDHVTFVQADQPGGAYQKTAYVYGVTTASGSGVNSNDILSAVQHPDPTTGDPSSSQQDSYLVNALGQTVQTTDRNHSVHTLTYDVLGRLTSDAVTTLGAGVDGAVQRIEYKYDSQGNNYLISSFDAATGGNKVNEVQRTFNGLGQLTNEYQSHSGAVNTSSTPQVQYAYNELAGGLNNSRLVSMTYPSNNYTVSYNYNAGLDSNISRLSSLSDSGNTLEAYKYLGLDTVVERDHPQPNVNQTYIQQPGDTQALTDGGDQYEGLDRFGRVIDQNWVNGATGVSTDRFQYGYNADSDVLYRQNLVDSVFSELYGYDNLHQLTSFQRGTLNATHDGIAGTPTHSQSWSPDALGNFTSVTTDSSQQTRTHNQQNEITSISGAGAVTYDANGNVTADGTGNTFVYDAWNRLVKVNNGGSTVAAYGYDGLGRRITETHGGTTTDLYLSSANQVLEEDVGGVAQARNVWSPEYVNALLLRDQSSLNNGVLDQRLYAQQDANWNITAFTDASGNVVERYAYDAYGAVSVLNPDFSPRANSTLNVPYGCQGMRSDLVVAVNFADNRVYSPTLQRWLQTDPITFDGGDTNLYRVEGNGPTGAVDPSGLIVLLIHGVKASGEEYSSDMDKGLTAYWAVNGIMNKDKQVPTVLLWTWKGVFGKPSAVQATGSVEKMGKAGKLAAEKLADFLIKLNKLYEKYPRMREPINIVAHSQGTIITLGALQKEDAKVDNLVFQGSPLNYENANTDICKSIKNVRGKIYNFYSKHDRAVRIPKGDVKGGEEWKLKLPEDELKRIVQKDVSDDVKSHSAFHTAEMSWKYYAELVGYKNVVNKDDDKEFKKEYEALLNEFRGIIKNTGLVAPP